MKMIKTAKAFHSMIKAAMAQNPDHYYDDEPAWVDKNISLIIRFFQEANKDRLGNDDYRSQHQIVEFLRNSTSARDSDKSFKINNDCVAMMAHLYNDCAPKKYFRTKKRAKQLRA